MPSEKRIIEVENLPMDIVDGATYSINQSNPNSYTHGMFKYPCKFIPEIPRWAISKYLNDKGKVFDPFAGSGTTVLESILYGNDAYSTEIDDIARLITRVKTCALDKEQIILLDDIFHDSISFFEDEKNAYKRPKINNLEHWFPEYTIAKLGRLKSYIDKIECEKTREFFYVCFISIIKKVSYADDTSPKPYVSNKIIKKPSSVEKEYRSVYERYKKMEEDLSEVNMLGKNIQLKGDALKFEYEEQFDIAITSPPYINAFDYGRTLRLENIWMEMLDEGELRDKKKKYIGTEKIRIKDEILNLEILERSALLKKNYYEINELDEKRALIVKRFFEDMEKNLIKVQSSLKNNGIYMLVIGNSSIREINVQSWKIIEELAHNLGYVTDAYFNYEIKNPYIRIPRKGQGGKITNDYVIVLRKKG